MNSNPYAGPGRTVDVPIAKKPSGFTWWELIIVLGIIAALASLLLPQVRRAGPAAYRTQCKNNLKLIALALHNYHDVHGAFPPAYTVDADGRPLHSWRTLILPYVDQQHLYERIDLTKPWDDPANLAVAKDAPDVYRCPSVDIADGFTTYCAVVGENACFDPVKSRHLHDISDGTSQTMMVFDVSQDEAVHWMAPHDTNERFLLKFNSETEFAHQTGTQAALADGSVRFLSADLSEADRRALISIAGDDEVSHDW